MVTEYCDRNPGPDSTSTVVDAVDEIEDNLYYLNDVVSAGIPDVGRIITDSILMVLIFPILLPSMKIVVDKVFSYSLYGFVRSISSTFIFGQRFLKKIAYADLDSYATCSY